MNPPIRFRYQGLPVRSIGAGAFENNQSIISVIISDSVISIGNKAFVNCISLESVSFGKRTESIGREAFYKCTALKELYIPANVKMIYGMASSFFGVDYYGAFGECTGLTKVTIGDSNTYEELTEIGWAAFQDCTALKEVYIGNSVMTISRQVFKNTGVETVVLGNNLTSIGIGAFENCDNLKNMKSQIFVVKL